MKEMTQLEGQSDLRISENAIGKILLNKVPEVTLFFWIIKIMATTVGETAADFLSVNLNLGLTVTTYFMSGLLVITLYNQFKLKKYVPGAYWLTVVLISIVGTLITDNLVDNLGISLVTTTSIFAIALALSFTLWYISEKTLSIHSIVTRRREGFYWAVILFTFALGTAAGDLVAEGLNIGYLNSALMFGTLIAIVAIAYKKLKMNSILAFWIAYILTRPLGASLGDLLSQPISDGGFAFGTVDTSAIFLTTIMAVVIYLTKTGRDQGLLNSTEIVKAQKDI
jgi:uncharacterized membrane-anchored protein